MPGGEKEGGVPQKDREFKAPGSDKKQKKGEKPSMPEIAKARASLSDEAGDANLEAQKAAMRHHEAIGDYSEDAARGEGENHTLQSAWERLQKGEISDEEFDKELAEMIKTDPKGVASEMESRMKELFGRLEKTSEVGGPNERGSKSLSREEIYRIAFGVKPEELKSMEETNERIRKQKEKGKRPNDEDIENIVKDFLGQGGMHGRSHFDHLVDDIEDAMNGGRIKEYYPGWKKADFKKLFGRLQEEQSKMGESEEESDEDF